MRNDEFLQVFLNHRTMLFAFIHALIRDPHAAEDVFQETSLALLQEASNFRSGDDFGAWSRAVARNRIKAHYRKRARDRALSEVAETALLRSYSDLNEDWWRERMEALSQCLEKLGDKARGILTAYYGEGRSAPETARLTGMSPTAVRIALCRTRQTLRTCVENHLEGRP